MEFSPDDPVLIGQPLRISVGLVAPSVDGNRSPNLGNAGRDQAAANEGLENTLGCSSLDGTTVTPRPPIQRIDEIGRIPGLTPEPVGRGSPISEDRAIRELEVEAHVIHREAGPGLAGRSDAAMTHGQLGSRQAPLLLRRQTQPRGRHHMLGLHGWHEQAYPGREDVDRPDFSVLTPSGYGSLGGDR